MKQNQNELIFLTVGNSRQKALYEKLLSNSALCRDSNIIVVSDSDSKRIGSGGAVFSIISEYFSPDKKLLIINSGGFSKRCINYAVRGKAFTDIIYNGKATTLFEAIIDKSASLMSKFSSGALVCCGDIFVNTDDTEIFFDTNIGFCAESNSTVGSRHGVMFSNASGIMTHFFHKAPVSVLEEFCSHNKFSYVPVDTGMVFLNDSFCIKAKQFEKQNNLTHFLREKNIDLNLYSDIVSLFASELSQQDYLSEATEESCLYIKKLLYSAFSEFRMKVITLDCSKFLHFGTLQETVDNSFLLSANSENYLSVSSFLSSTSEIGNNTILNNVILENDCKIGSSCLVTDIILNGVSVPDNSSVCGIKLLDGSYVTILCDINENPKTLVNGISLWDTPRFYKGTSFTDSYNKLILNQSEQRLSLAECVEYADYSYYFEHKQIFSDISSHTYHEKYAKYRRKITSDYFSKHSPCTSISYKRDKVQLNLPVRINLSGTWSDAMPYCIENGGQVLNIAIKVNNTLPINIIAEKRNDSEIVFVSDNKSIVYDFSSPALLDDFSDFILHKAVIDVMGITAQTNITNGFTLTTKVSEIDKGSGLGTSSILLGGCIVALSSLFGTAYSRNDIIKMVFVAEQLMKTGGGWQDQVGGLIPGIKITTTKPGIDQYPEIHNLQPSDTFKEFVKSKFVLIPTGLRHFGRFIVTDVVNRYLDGQQDVLSSYRDIIELNAYVQESIKNDNFDLLRKCINKHFSYLKKISPKITNQSIEHLIDAVSPFVDGVSVCGAGGGGYLLAILRDNISSNDLQSFMTETFPGITSPVLNVDISFDRMMEI